jgi:ribosomal protein S18 acetylase RimI-like enzyme
MEIVLLAPHHSRAGFQCEEPSLTDYIRTQVSQDVRKRLAVCYVAADAAHQVVGYYTLSSESLGRASIPDRYLNKVPKSYNAPVIVLGRLARDIKARGTGLGEHLLLDALFRAYTLSRDSLGAMAVVVDPINDHAAHWYGTYGFELLPDSGKMFLPMGTIQQLI